jgi:hypothetical protein
MVCETKEPSAPLGPAAISISATPWRHSGILAAFAAFAAYLLFPTRDFYWDGISFAHVIETSYGNSAVLLHPNHLLYNLLGYAAWRAAAAVGIQVRALYVLQALSAVLAAATVYLIWRILVEWTRSARQSFWGALLFAFAAQWWRFATDANAYIPSIFFLLLSFYFLAGKRTTSAWAAGLACGAALLLHQLAIFFFPAAVAALWRQARCRAGETARRRFTRGAAQYFGVAVPIAAAIYIWAYSVVRNHPGAPQFWKWLTNRAEEAVFTFDLARNLSYGARGTARLFFGGRFNQVQIDWVVVTGLLAFGATLVLAVCHLIRAQRSLPQVTNERVPADLRAWLSLNLPGMIWMLSYAAFLLIMLPQNTFYRLFYLPPLISLIATIPFRRVCRVRLLMFLAGIVAFWNFAVLIYPHSKAVSNEVLAFALEHQKDWCQNAVILYGHSHSDLWLISYFNPQVAWIEVPAPQVDEMERRRLEARAAGNPLWLEGTMYDLLAAVPGGKVWLDENVDPTRSFLHLTPTHKVRYYQTR